jgi:hypothetical protein
MADMTGEDVRTPADRGGLPGAGRHREPFLHAVPKPGGLVGGSGFAESA